MITSENKTNTSIVDAYTRDWKRL